MDVRLHQQRTQPAKPVEREQIQLLPPGIIITTQGRFFAWLKSGFAEWQGRGYEAADPPGNKFEILTPTAIVAVLKEGYQPVWHESAKQLVEQ